MDIRDVIIKKYGDVYSCSSDGVVSEVFVEDVNEFRSKVDYFYDFLQNNSDVELTFDFEIGGHKFSSMSLAENEEMIQQIDKCIDKLEDIEEGYQMSLHGVGCVNDGSYELACSLINPSYVL